MFLGGSTSRGTNVPSSVKTDFQLQTEQNKNLRKLNDTLCNLIKAVNVDTSVMESTLTQIQQLLTTIAEQGSTCDTPSHVSLCELQQILDALNNIAINIDAGDININLQDLEDLVTALMTQLKTPNTNHVVVDNFPTGAGVTYNNVKQYMKTYPETFSLAANSVHAVSYKILKGVTTIMIGTDAFPYIEGEVDTEEATTLIEQPYTFTPQQGSTIKIKIIY